MPDDPTETDSWVGDDSAICDFCGDKDIQWRYPADSFAQELQTYDGIQDAISIGDWAACDPCHTVIELSDARRLAEHVQRRNPVINTQPDWVQQGITDRLTVLYEEFYTKAGIAYRYTTKGQG